MSAATRRLEPLRFPLHGSRLIEASAGTGKTFTLAMLYLRLILQHGGEHAYTRPLLPPEILVVTFTNAATEELRERVRRRLVEAAAVFRGRIADADADALLVALRDALGEEASTRGARQLELAAEWMDEAAISTIHAWCYRMLREHAFDSGSAFDQTLENSDADLLQQACEDYWRSFYLDLSVEDLRQVQGQWAKPADFAKALRALLPVCDRLASAEAPEATLRRCREEHASRLGRIKSEWRSRGYIEALGTLLEEAAKAKAFAQSKLKSNHRETVLQRLRDWLAEPEQIDPGIFDGASWRRMSSLEIAEIWKDPGTAPVDHPACRALADLKPLLKALPTPHRDLLLHAVHWVKARLELEKQQRGMLTQHDLLVCLDSALRSARGERLAASIRAQFPVAMVDEFQDTDPLQYRIFDTIYRVASSDPDTGFFMIGDPKQAIYSFRGADIYTYLIARADTAGRHYTLGINYRSAPALIDAVNALFALGERERARGAFLFREGEESPVPFLPVDPRPQAEGCLAIDGAPAPPMQVWLAQESLGKTAYGARMAEASAREIVRLLQLGQQGRARLPDDDGGDRALQPSDLAVLVNHRGEAELMRDALACLGVASVYLSERSNVFGTAVAGELVILLRALADPLDERLLRQALATPLLGLSLSELDRLNRDELYWEALGERFRAYHAVWRRQGVLPLVYRLMTDFQVAARLLAASGGERALTDLLHLGELLQAASEQLDGELALVRYFEEARADAEADVPDAQQLRLESDEHLVRVVTIHKSKGLEYPLVFLPFILNFRATKKEDLPLRTHDSARRLQVHLSGDEAICAQADQERLGEDLRKLYVALTRARFANWLGLAPRADVSGSAIGYLLGADEQSLAECVRRLSALTETPILETDPPAYDARGGVTLERARPAPELALTPWWITSYSALKKHALPFGAAEHGGPAPEPPGSAETAAQETALEEAGTAERTLGAAKLYPEKHLHGLPRGSRYGTFLHGILEWAAAVAATDDDGRRLQGFAAAAWSRALRREMLGQRCNLRRLTDWIEPLDAWLDDFLRRAWILRTLPDAAGAPPRLRLCDLPPERAQVEMEFWLESRSVDVGRLDQLVQRHVLPGRPRPSLEGYRINGMLKGFIDLVFEHEGRYYVVDWKSNWLGPDDAAYSEPAMRDAILQARYELQYVLYLLALHRQLRARLSGYDYDRHVGGAVYVFLRGTYAETQGLFMDKPPRALIETLDALLAGQTPEDGA